jgi:DNA-directed RNA polymerase subunit RPC12/RpoP
MSRPGRAFNNLAAYSLPVIAISRLKCSKCGKTFEKKAVTDYAIAGVAGARAGVGYSSLLWPFTMRVYATCPSCNEKCWLNVLPPWKKE